MFEGFKEFIWLLSFMSFVHQLGGIVIKNDITANPEFGCQWTGGSVDSGVICVCQPYANEFFIQKGSIPSYDAQIIKIHNCNSVRFGSNSITEMRNLRRLQLSNINSLSFESSALSWSAYVQANNDYPSTWDSIPSLKIEIEKSIIKVISSYTFQGRISSITIEDSLIENIAPFAFSSLVHTKNLEFSNIEFSNIEAQAFKKFPTEVLMISESKFNFLPSRTFSDLSVLDSLQVKNCSFGIIRSGAFLIKQPKRFEFVNSEVETLEGDAFKITMRGSVKFKNCAFNTTNRGAFAGISLNKEEVLTDEEIMFDTITFNNFVRGVLDVNSTSFSRSFNDIFIREDCRCRLIDDIANEEFQCLHETQKITFKDFKDNHCSVMASYSTIIIIIVVVLVLFVVIFSALMVYLKCFYKNHTEYLTDKNGKPISLIMPDGRTYRETELHVVVERADLLTTDL